MNGVSLGHDAKCTAGQTRCDFQQVSAAIGQLLTPRYPSFNVGINA
jgi:hypothetical protein